MSVDLVVEPHKKVRAGNLGLSAENGLALSGVNRCFRSCVTRQEEEIKKLKARIVELETGHWPIVKTSANSSVPPSYRQRSRTGRTPSRSSAHHR